MRGFSLIELIIVVVLLGVISVTALPRFFASSDVKEITIQDQLISIVRLDQTQAMQNTATTVTFQLSQATSQLLDTNSTLQIQLFDTKAGGGNALSDFRFNSMGQPLIDNGSGTFVQASNGLRIEILGTVGRKVCIESEGYIWPC